MIRYIVVLAIGLFALSGCGGGDEPPRKDASSQTLSASPTPGPTTSPTPTAAPTTQPATPSFAILDKDGLEDALLSIQEMPDGFSQDPPSDTSTDTTFCNYKEPHKAKVEVSRDFTKGAGMAAEVASTGFRQYGSAADAKESFDALAKTMDSCTSQDFQGERLTYSVIKVPALGAGSIGIRIDSGSSTILQNFAVVGPTLVNAGIGGITNADSDASIGLLETQVQKYSDAAAS